MARLKRLLSWAELSGLAEARSKVAMDRVSGPTNSQANLRLFGRPEGSEELTLYRDHHAWSATIIMRTEWFYDDDNYGDVSILPHLFQTNKLPYIFLSLHNMFQHSGLGHVLHSTI